LEWHFLLSKRIKTKNKATDIYYNFKKHRGMYVFEKLDVIDSAPFDLLLLANPSKELLLKYLESGECFVYKIILKF